MLLHKTFRTGFVFLSWSKWVQAVVCYDQNLQKHKYLGTISVFLHETFRTGLVFLSCSKWFQRVVCYDQNLQNHKYLSTISIFLHETFRTRLNFLTWLKWAVVWYNQNLQKHKYPAQYQYFCTKPSEQGSFFWAGRNHSKQLYAMHDINASAWNLQNRARFSELVKMSPNSGMLWSKLTET